ncbi:putative sporulation protein YtxC [Virgibacillus xinjiangensis]|uniref:Sporulation protein YtxC n=1 Tax=Virgibacillus xinjiangensis TaxID=393090 RepID=A0ABV7CUS4_9BACI
MLHVYFETDKEVIRFCEHLFRCNKRIELYWKTHKDWGNHLQFERQLPVEELNEAVACSMVEVFVAHRLNQSFRSIIEEVFYYTNEEEIERILDLALWLFRGEDDESRFLLNGKDPKQLLLSTFLAHMEDARAVHFDSIVKFRLNGFREHLIQYVGLAIDEFKREEEHQEFVESLRKYITRKDSGVELVHVLQGKTFTFFKENGRQLSRLELRNIMQKEPLFLVGLNVEEWNLAPLIAMSPKKIKIYGEDPAEPKTLTVINVFQEKVEFEPSAHFPFPQYLKKNP